MVDVKALGRKLEKAKRVNMILMILGLIFLVVPFIGVFTAVPRAIAQVATVVGEAGNAALAVTEFVMAEGNLAVAFLSLVADVIPMGRSGFSNAASKRKGISDTDLKKFGTGFSAREAQFQRVMGATYCVRK